MRGTLPQKPKEPQQIQKASFAHVYLLVQPQVPPGATFVGKLNIPYLGLLSLSMMSLSFFSGYLPCCAAIFVSTYTKSRSTTAGSNIEPVQVFPLVTHWLSIEIVEIGVGDEVFIRELIVEVRQFVDDAT